MFNYTWQAEQQEATLQQGSKTTAHLSAGRANNNQPPHHPKKETILRVQTAGREEVRETGTRGLCEEIRFLQLIFDHLKLLFGVKKMC